MSINIKKFKISYIISALVGLIIVAFPFVIHGYNVRFITMIFIYIALSQAWNILGGYAGYISLGIAGPIGLGAYTTGVLMTMLNLPYYIAILGGGLTSGLFALIIGIPILRLKSGYFAIATFAVGYILREVVNNLTWLTGGGMGLALPIREGGINSSNVFFYFLMLFFAAGATLLCYIISKSRLGYGLLAIKEDEEAACALGVNTTSYKVISFTLSSLIAGAVGGAYAYYLTFIEPISAFDSSMSIIVIAMVLIGGAGTVFGPISGAVIITILSEFLWNKFLELHTGFLGIVLIIIVLFIPKGIIDILKSDKKRSFHFTINKIKENFRNFRI